MVNPRLRVGNRVMCVRRGWGGSEGRGEAVAVCVARRAGELQQLTGPTTVTTHHLPHH